jgi:hypothetical protein
MSHFTSDRSDPVFDPDLSDLWSSLRVPGFDDELAGGRSVVATIIAHGSATTGRVHGRRSRGFGGLRVKIATVGLAAAFAASCGLAYAGDLPGAAQPLAATMLARVGISVTGANSHAGTHPATRGKSAHAGEESGHGSTSAVHGRTVATLARTTTATGRSKGALIAATASAGRSTKGQDTAATRSGGRSTTGQSVAAGHSGSHTSHQPPAAAGSRHRSSGQQGASSASSGAASHANRSAAH